MRGTWLHRFAVILAVAAFVAVAAGSTSAGPGGGAAGMARAVLLHAAFATAVLFAVRTGMSWRGPAVRVDDSGWPSLRSMAVVTPLFVLLQIGFGAAYRQQAMGLTAHVLWALVTAVLLMMASTFVLTHEQQHKPMRHWALAVMSATICQVMLGVLAFVARLSTGPAGQAEGWKLGAIQAHVGTGTLVLGSVVALSAWILRDVVPARGRSGGEAAEPGRNS